MHELLTWAFGIALTLVVFQAAVLLNRKVATPLLNPLLVTVALIIALLAVFRIPLETYQQGAQVVSWFLAPATAVLGYSIYRQIAVLKRHFVPIVCGCLAGSVTSMLSAYGLCRLFGLDEALALSTVPKSVTTPIAMSVSQTVGGITSVTVAVVIVTGIMGSMLAPLMARAFRVKDPVACGVAIGTCSHAIGTTRAMRMGELEGAMSSVAIGVTGLLTMVIALAWRALAG